MITLLLQNLIKKKKKAAPYSLVQREVVSTSASLISLINSL